MKAFQSPIANLIPAAEPWKGADGQPLSDEQLRQASQSWDTDTWERYLRSLEKPLKESQVSTKRFDLIAEAESIDIGDMVTSGSDQSTASLKLALAHLTKRQSEVLELIFFGAKSSREVAEALGLSQSTVRDLKRKGLKNLRLLLEGGTLSFPIGKRPTFEVEPKEGPHADKNSA